MSELPAIPGYRIQRVLGSGSAGVVYLAVQVALDREVALKVLTGWISDRSGRQRFQLEAQVLGGLSHPHLLRLYEYQDDAVPWLSVEYLPGGSLRDRIRLPDGSGQPLPVEQAVRLARNLLSALEALHAAHLIHRDVKPANILFRANGDAVLGDLGLVRQSDSEKTRLTRAIDMVGTAAYLAPEVQSGRELSEETDLYAAGVTIYEALTGRHPTDWTPISPGTVAVPPIEIKPEIPPEISDLVVWMLDVDPRKRPKSAKDALARLPQKRVTSRRIPKPASKPAPRDAADPGITAPRVRSSPWKRALASGAVLGLAAGLLAANLPRPKNAAVISVEAKSTAVHARVPVPASELLLCIYDEQGRVVSCVNGEPAAGETRFDTAGLQPGTRYHAHLYDRRTGPAALAAPEAVFRTPIQLKLLGVEAGDPPGLWLSVSPPAQAKWTGGVSSVQVGPDGKRLDLPAAAPRVLTLQFDSGEKVTVKVTGEVAARAGDPVLPIGVAVPKLAGQIQEGPKSRSLVDWLVDAHVGWVAVSPHADGSPGFAPKESDALWRRGKIATLYLIQANGPPAQAAWMQKPGEFEAGRIEVGIDGEWMSDTLDNETYVEKMRTIAAWRDAFRARKPPVHLILPTTGMLWMNLDGKGARQIETWAQIAPEIESLESTATTAPIWHQNWKSGMEARLKQMGFKVAVRWMWMMRARRETLWLDLPIERFSLARAYAMARARFPQAVFVEDVGDLTDGPERQARPAFAELLWIARTLDGLTFERELGDPKAPAPRVSGPSLMGMAYNGERRRVQVIFPAHTSSAGRFEPARPGIYRDQASGVTRPVLNTSPIDVALTDGSAVFEEFAPVEADVQSETPVEVQK